MKGAFGLLEMFSDEYEDWLKNHYKPAWEAMRGVSDVLMWKIDRRGDFGHTILVLILFVSEMDRHTCHRWRDLLNELDQQAQQHGRFNEDTTFANPVLPTQVTDVDLVLRRLNNGI